MDFELYKNYVTVAESYTISEAARRLNIAQPALSMQMKNLEIYYGVKLIKAKQGSRHIELTEAGEVLYQRLKHLLNEAEVVRREVKLSDKRENKSVLIGVSSGLVGGLGSLISKFMMEYEEKGESVSYSVTVHEKKFLSEQLRRGKIHFMITSSPPSQAYLYQCEGEKEKNIYAIAPKGYRLFKGKSYFRLQSLTEDGVCIPTDLEEAFFKACREEDVTIPIHFKGNSLLNVFDVAIQKNMIALVAGDIPNWILQLVDILPVRCKYMQEKEFIYTYKGANKSKLVKRFIQFLMR